MGDRPFPSEKGTPGLEQNFHRKLTNGKRLEMLKEQEIRSSPDLFSVEADRIDPCLTNEQKHKASGSQGLSVLGLNENGEKWNLQLRKENGSYFFTETRNQMTTAYRWGPGTKICIWGAPDGRFTDKKVRFLFTVGM